MLTVSHLTKRYGELLAVDDISFRAPEGAIFGLLGPNGAGKSTTIGCINGLLKPGAGNITVAGFDTGTQTREAKAAMGVVPQELALYDDLTARENLMYWGGAYGLRGAQLAQRADELLRRIGLADRPKDQVKKFSGGMKRRLNFACALLHRPKVLLLDEPTVGVDPQSRVALLDLVREEVQLGTCVLYTTHYMEEAEALCDRVGIIDHGHLIAQGTLGELRKLHGERDLLRLSGVFDPARTLRLQHDEDFVVGVFVVVARRGAEVEGMQRAADRTVADRRVLRRGDGDLRFFHRVDHRNHDAVRPGVQHALDVIVIASGHAGQHGATGVGDGAEQQSGPVPPDRRMFQVDRQPRETDAGHQPRGGDVAQRQPRADLR